MWLLAIAMVGVQAMGIMDLRQTIYLTANFIGVGYIAGGLIFGIGLTIGSGCGQRTLARVSERWVHAFKETIRDALSGKS